MLTNDIKKGMRFKLACGWSATMEDNRKGNTRMATVEGLYTEMGSVYAHDIVRVLNPETKQWEGVEYTPAQEKLRLTVRSMGF
jgi:hypothetical protein